LYNRAVTADLPDRAGCRISGNSETASSVEGAFYGDRVAVVLIFPEYPRPIPSFRAPVPAPTVEPTDAPLVSVCFNYDWLPYVLGALTQLTLQSTWSGFNDPPDALAMRRGASLMEQFALAYDDASCPVVFEYPTPFWDETSDLEDDQPADMQEWYGYVTEPEAPADELTFVEDAAIWVMTGFIAYAGDIGAAIFFRTIAKSWVFAWRRGDIGEVIRVIIDGAEYGRVDTTSASVGDLVQMPIIAGDGAHDITMIKVA